MLILNILLDQLRSDFVSHCPHKISTTPKLPRPKLPLQLRKFLKYLPRNDTLKNLYYFSRRITGRSRKKNINMNNFDSYDLNLRIILFRYRSKQLLYPVFKLPRQNVFPIFRYPNKMILYIIDCLFRPILYKLTLAIEVAKYS